MLYGEFIREVEARAAGGLDQERARQATLATLTTLAEQLSPREAKNLAAQLPKELKGAFARPGARTRPLSATEFVHRVADREGVSASEAFDRTRAVFDVLLDAVTIGELEDVLAELPEDLASLMKRPAARAWPDEHLSPDHAKHGHVPPLAEDPE